MLSHNLSDMSFCRHSFWQIYPLTFFWHMTYLLTFFCHFVWQSFWHLSWLSVWHSFWHLFWHFFWQSFWASLLTFCLLVEVRQRTLAVEDRGWSPGSRLKCGSEHWPWRIASGLAENTGLVGSRLGPAANTRGRRRKRRRWTDPKSNNTHLTGGIRKRRYTNKN